MTVFPHCLPHFRALLSDPEIFSPAFQNYMQEQLLVAAARKGKAATALGRCKYEGGQAAHFLAQIRNGNQFSPLLSPSSSSSSDLVAPLLPSQLRVWCQIDTHSSRFNQPGLLLSPILFLFMCCCPPLDNFGNWSEKGESVIESNEPATHHIPELLAYAL